MKKVFIWLCIYSLIFFTEPTFSEVNNQKKDMDVDAELLRTLLSAFLGASDLKNALEVAKRGTKLYPSDPFWWEWYGKISGWLGYNEEFIKASRKLIELRPNKKLISETFKYAMSIQRYDFAVELITKYPYLAKELKQDEIYFIYLSAGRVEEYIRLIESMYIKEKNPEYLYYMALVQFKYKDKNKALIHMRELERLRTLNIREVLLYSDILQAFGMHQEDYLLLKTYLEKIKKEEEESLLVSYYMRLSAVAWSMKDIETAALASEILDNMNKAESEQYTRLYLYYSIKGDYKRAIEYAKKGYKKTGDAYIFILWIEGLISQSLWKEALEAFRNFDKEKLLNNNYLLLLYLRVLYKNGEAKTARNILIKTLNKEPSKEFLSNSIYIALEFMDARLMEHILIKYRNQEEQLIKEFALIYLALQDAYRAKILMDRLEKKDKEDLLIYSYILSALGREEESRFIRYTLSKELLETSGLEEDPQMLKLALSSGMGILPAVKYQQLLNKGKELLPKEVWLDIYLSYLFTINTYERIERMRDVEKVSLSPWMELNLALRRNDKEQIDNLLKEQAETLPRRDVVESYRRLGLRLTAMGYAYYGMEKKPEDALLYEQMRQLTDEYGNNVQAGLSYRIGEKTEYLKNELSLRYAIDKKWSLLYDAEAGFLSSSRNPTYTNLPRRFQYHTLSLRRWFESGYQQLSFYAGEGVYSFAGLNLTLSGRVFRINNLSLSSYFNMKASESLIAQLGMLKDGFSVSSFESITPRIGLSSSAEYSWFKSQDMKYIGRGFSGSASLFHKLRYTYPDYTHRVYLSFFTYEEEEKKSQSILKLFRVSNPRVLPQSGLTLGTGFSFGTSSKEMLSRPPLPFLDSEISYSLRSGFGYGLSVGITGRLIGRDLITIGLKGFSNLQTTEGIYIEPFLKYRLNF